MRITEVHDSQTKRLFHHVLRHIYRKDPHFIHPMENDVDFVFDQDRNPVYAGAKSQRWVAIDERGIPLGRIAAYYQQGDRTNGGAPLGGLGFFESVDQAPVAHALFDTALQWLGNEGIEAVEGPVCLGDVTKYRGVMIEGFSAPTYLENYNPSYYAQLWESYGFSPLADYDTYRIDRENFDAHRFTNVAEWISRKPGFEFAHFAHDQAARFAKDYVEIYNQAWQGLENFKPATERLVYNNLKAMRHILVEDFIWFGYVQGEPAGVMVMIPDVNQLLKHVNSKLDTLNRLKFLLLLKTMRMTQAKGLVFGVVPKYRQYGIETVLIYKFYKAVSQTWQYHTVELPWIGKTNERMASLMEKINAVVAKKHRIYRLSLASHKKIHQ
ncbi:MAG: hypothetical protein HYZ16_04205 [Bacteroidetes bacterium]|jgi:hypothetical protein|nr:hypothetical protein [Bacteroidota bacterium]